MINLPDLGPCVFAVGGRDDNNSPLLTAEAYVVNQNRWMYLEDVDIAIAGGTLYQVGSF